LQLPHLAASSRLNGGFGANFKPPAQGAPAWDVFDAVATIDASIFLCRAKPVINPVLTVAI
jgi:hypothetical protein